MSRIESGVVTSLGPAVRGSYEYIGSDGLVYRVTYTADSHGYRAR